MIIESSVRVVRRVGAEAAGGSAELPGDGVLSAVALGAVLTQDDTT
ncbi:hypothetical protein FHX42_003778 [Saccharopolyspora lacisalsi]|uniref:Uncharacterized protein n=1 Tax=Halosaccharopolyspora lacisalsi TaxID=1000566 RepID=A0A839DWR0_9PSEU|nr:hypothetical protein [Halosaccharopolyspora lacisalsi]MBA8826402.1 hypothetical protein [Halosaccharopolyspora lacisalsi]